MNYSEWKMELSTELIGKYSFPFQLQSFFCQARLDSLLDSVFIQSIQRINKSE